VRAQQMNAGDSLAKRSHDVPSTVRRPVVHNKDLEPGILTQSRLNDARNVLALIVGRNDDKGSFSHGPFHYEEKLRAARYSSA